MIEYIKSFSVGFLTLTIVAAIALFLVNHPNLFLGLIITTLTIAFSLAVGDGLRKLFRKDSER